MLPYNSQRNLQCLILWEALDPCCDQGKGNALAAKLIRKEKGFPITGTQDVILSVLSVDPRRPYGMNDIFAGS